MVYRTDVCTYIKVMFVVSIACMLWCLLWALWCLLWALWCLLWCVCCLMGVVWRPSYLYIFYSKWIKFSCVTWMSINREHNYSNIIIIHFRIIWSELKIFVRKFLKFRRRYASFENIFKTVLRRRNAVLIMFLNFIIRNWRTMRYQNTFFNNHGKNFSWFFPSLRNLYP